MLEALLGIGLFGICILFVFRLVPAADAAEMLAERTTQATLLAHRLLEDQLAQDYDSVVPLSGTVQHRFADRRGTSLLMTYTYQVDVATVVASPQKLKSVRVRVTWFTGSGSGRMNREVKLDTLKGAQ